MAYYVKHMATSVFPVVVEKGFGGEAADASRGWRWWRRE